MIYITKIGWIRPIDSPKTISFCHFVVVMWLAFSPSRSHVLEFILVFMKRILDKYLEKLSLVLKLSSLSWSQPSLPLLADGLHNLHHALRSWAILIHWLPTASSLSSVHLLLGLPLIRFPPLGVHSDVIFAHLVLFILATCPAHCPFMPCTFSVISVTPVVDLIISFLILSLFVTFNNDLFMLRWATASFLSGYFVKVHVSAP